VRNRVAMKVAQTGLRRLVRVSVVLALVPVALLAWVTAASASSTDEAAAAAGPSFGIGPVAIAAVVVGFGGLVTGLLRHRRRVSPAAVDPQRPSERPASDRAA
jgi:hypothetical protein